MCSHGPIFRRIGTDVPPGVGMKDDRENRVNDPSEGSRGGALRRDGRTARAEGAPGGEPRTGVTARTLGVSLTLMAPLGGRLDAGVSLGAACRIWGVT